MHLAYSHRIAAAAALALLSASHGLAQEGDSENRTRWSAEAGIGFEYDTNVSVDEVDLTSGQSDTAWIVDFELGMRHNFSEKTAATLTYDISQSSYSEFSRVDRLTQIAGADLSHDLGKARAGVSAYYIDSRLDNQAFLQYVRMSPSLSGFLAQKWFARGAYVYSEREIEERPQRDATTQTGEFDLYYFHRGLRSYVNIGYRYRDEDAVAQELDFDAHALKLRYIRRFDLWGKKAKAEAALRYEVRDYLSDEPTIGEPRNDDRLRVKFDFEIPLSPRLTWQASASYGDYISNLPRADFTQTIVSTRLQYAWD